MLITIARAVVAMIYLDMIRVIILELKGMVRMTTGQRLRKISRKRDLSVREISKSCGVLLFRRRFVRRLLSDEIKMTPKIAMGLEKATGVLEETWLRNCTRRDIIPMHPQGNHKGRAKIKRIFDFLDN